MQGIQPSGLTSEELVKYAWLHQESLSPAWVKELIIRLEKALDSIDELEAALE